MITREDVDQIKTDYGHGKISWTAILQLTWALEQAVKVIEFYADERNRVMIQVPPTRGMIPGSNEARAFLKEFEGEK